ncbi:MAG: hypothetical protein R2911_26965 [Caldilineaceae bacterium]
MTPGLIFVQDGAQYERALTAVLPTDSDIELVVVDNPVAAPRHRFSDLLAMPATPAVDAAAAAVGPDTVAKVLFTSGSTSLPKGVINTNRMICANLPADLSDAPFYWRRAAGDCGLAALEPHLWRQPQHRADSGQRRYVLHG